MNFDTEDPEEMIKELDLQETKSLKERSIQKLDTKSTWEMLKHLSHQYYKDKKKFRLFISKEKELEGKVTHKEGNSLHKIALIKETISIEDVKKIMFFDEEMDRRGRYKIIDNYYEDFWIYKFRSKNKEYVLLVDKDEELDFEDYNIKGTLVNIQDFAEVGKYSKILTQTNLILLHSAKKRILQFKDSKEFMKRAEELKLHKENKLRHFMFSKGKVYLTNPQQYEDLLMAVLFSCKKDDYPLHFMGVGLGGCGKTTVLEALHSKSGEENIFEGRTSTFKALIPSYKGTNVEIGHMFMSKMWCWVDEFLGIIQRLKHTDERDSQLTYLNDVLEHKRRLRGSGNCKFDGQMSSKFISFTNPIWSCQDMKEMVHKFEESLTTLSRIMILWYPQEHISFVIDQKKNKKKTEVIPTSKNDFLGILTYLYDVECSFEDKKIRKIYDKITGYLKAREEYSLLLNMFEQRYYHHMECLIDGIIKTRCVQELDQSFKAKPEDYVKLEELMKYLLSSWKIEIIDEITVKS